MKWRNVGCEVQVNTRLSEAYKLGHTAYLRKCITECIMSKVLNKMSDMDIPERLYIKLEAFDRPHERDEGEWSNS